MKKPSRLDTRNARTAYSFLLPCVLTILIVTIVPLVLAINISFHDVNLMTGNGAFVPNRGRNYGNLFKDARFYNSLLITAFYVLGAVSVETVLSVFISLLLNRRFRGKNLVRTLIIVPMFITPVVVALSWRMFYDPTSGIVNWLLGSLGLGNRHDWLGSAALALPAILIADVWEWTPFMVLIILAGLESVPMEFYEAAYVDGASELQAIRHISLPLVVSAIVVAAVLRTIDALKAFDLIYVMTRGGPGLATETANMYAYTIGFQYFRIGYATTAALVFTFIVTFGASALINRLLTVKHS